jgi:hypothetical protein
MKKPIYRRLVANKWDIKPCPGHDACRFYQPLIFPVSLIRELCYFG